MQILVLLCSYNGESYLREQVESILKQTEPGVRLLISDDASSDRSGEIAEAYAARYPERVCLIRRAKSSGSAAKHFMEVLLKQAAELAPEAEYVMLADQDDVWHPDKAERTLSAMRKAEQHFEVQTPLLVHCDMRIVDAAGRRLADSYVKYQHMSPKRVALHQLLVQNNVTGGAVMLNGALIRLLRSRPVPAHPVMHDHWMALVAAAFGRVVFLPEALYDYRQHGANVLGASKGSCVREVLDRLGIFRRDGRSKQEMDAHSQRVYRGLFLQAEELLKQYGEKLSPEQEELLRAFLSLPGKSRLGKIRLILRYGFTFNQIHRTVGECLFM